MADLKPIPSQDDHQKAQIENPRKDAVRKGAPSNAHWTRVDRRLVNPEALDLANERYEERSDCIIVLRVLQKEEIEKLVLLTQELRSRRAAAGKEEKKPRMASGEDSSQPYYVGFYLTQSTSPDGETLPQMDLTQAEFAERMKSSKTRPDELLESNFVSEETRSQIEQILYDYQQTEVDPSKEWKLANIIPTQSMFDSLRGKYPLHKDEVIRPIVIIKRTSRSPEESPRRRLSLPQESNSYDYFHPHPFISPQQNIQIHPEWVSRGTMDSPDDEYFGDVELRKRHRPRIREGRDNLSETSSISSTDSFGMRSSQRQSPQPPELKVQEGSEAAGIEEAAQIEIESNVENGSDTTSGASESPSGDVFSIGGSQQPTITTNQSAMGHQARETDKEDIWSVYSADSVMTGNIVLDSVELLAQHVADEMLSLDISSEALKDIELSELLKGFACELGYSNPDAEHLIAMIFIRKHRRTIADAILSRLGSIYDGNTKPVIDVPEMSLADKMKNWDGLEATESFEEQHIDEQAEFYEKEEDGNSRLRSYLNIVLNSSEWARLLKKTERTLKYQTSSGAMSDISGRILALDPGRGKSISRKRPESLKMTFVMDWSPEQFLTSIITNLEARNFPNDEIVSIDALEHEIVLVGGPVAPAAIATTRGIYVDMIWGSRGLVLLDLMKAALAHPGRTRRGSAPNIFISACLENDKIFVSCEGETHAVAEMGELIAWLNASFHVPEDDVLSLIPHVTIQPSGPSSKKIKDYSYQHDLHCIVGLTPIKSGGQLPGDCWQAMFENAIIIQGFPIPRRPDTVLGLEVSLSIIAVMLRTKILTYRNRSTFIRNFNHALVPIVCEDKILQWHYIYNGNGKSIPYWKVDSFDKITLKASELSQYRHFVGWCTDAESKAGNSDQNYLIKRSQLSPPSRSILLESFNLSGSQFIGATIPIKFGVRRPAIHITPDEFPLKIRDLRKRYVVLWDCGEKRGWLVDGLSALLHLLRASLLAMETDETADDMFCLNRSELVDGDGGYPLAALKFFFKDKKLHPNMKLQIYAGLEDDKGYLVQHHVLHLYGILNDIIEQQHKIATKDGYAFSNSPRQNLLGWDFINVATDQDFYDPYAISLSYMGAAWVDLVRSIRAVVLFGRGFGEIIKPADPNQLCAHWSKLPRDSYYLAATVSTMNSIRDRFGKTNTMPTSLTDHLIWHSPSTAFGCLCTSSESNGKQSDLATMIWPAKWHRLLPQSQVPPSWHGKGAVALGQNKLFPWYWPNQGDPRKGEEASEQLDSSNVLDSERTDSTGDNVPVSSATSVQDGISTSSRRLLGIFKRNPKPPV